MEYPANVFKIYIKSEKWGSSPARDLAKFFWALTNFADVGSPYVYKRVVGFP
jgi:hypothetical protein